MFLQSLTLEEREAFLELAYCAADIDGKTQESEEALISLYRAEADLHCYEIKKTKLSELIDYFASKSDKVKKQVFFETLGVLWIDNQIKEEEVLLIKQLQDSFGINDTLKYKIIKWMDTELAQWFQLAERLNKSGAELLGL